MTAGGSTTREEHRKRERQNAEMQVEGTGNIRFTRRDACLQCTRSDFCSIPLRFCASSSFHALPTTMNILCPRTSGVRSAPLQQMKFERSTRIHQIGSCCVETEAPQFTKWNCETIFVGIYHERREKYMCKKNGKYYNVGVGTDDRCDALRFRVGKAARFDSIIFLMMPCAQACD